VLGIGIGLGFGVFRFTNWNFKRSLTLTSNPNIIVAEQSNTLKKNEKTLVILTPYPEKFQLSQVEIQKLNRSLDEQKTHIENLKRLTLSKEAENISFGRQLKAAKEQLAGTQTALTEEFER
jgi:pseudouridine-5'-phosphate glycosidase